MKNSMCSGRTNGVLCSREAVISSPVELCNTHRLEVALGVLPSVLIDAMKNHETEFSAPVSPVIVAERIAFETLPAGTHEPVVYFISNGGRIKIGYTTNLHSRLSSLTLRQNNVLAVLRGGPDLERSLHAKFSSHRVGDTEWFEAVPDLLSYAAERPKVVRVGGVIADGLNVAELVREYLPKCKDNKEIVEAVMEAVPTAKQESVAATVRRERKKLDGPYL